MKRERHFLSETSDEELLVQTPSSETENFPREMIEQLPELIGKLSPASRAVIVLYYLNELSLNETAAVLEIPVGTVKSRLAYGLAKLRREFET